MIMCWYNQFYRYYMTHATMHAQQQVTSFCNMEALPLSGQVLGLCYLPRM